MLRRVLIATLATAIAVSANAGTVWHKKVDAAQKAAKKNGGQLIFVDLFAEWCGWCHRMEREVFPAEPFQKATDKMVLLRLDTEDKGEGTRFARELGINSLPTFVILTPELTVAAIIRGYAPAKEFAATLNAELKRYEVFSRNLANETKFDAGKRLEFHRELIARRAFADAEKRLVDLVLSKKTPVAVRDEGYFLLVLSQSSQKKYVLATKTIDSFVRLGSTGKMAEQIQFMKAQIFLEQKHYQPALAELKRFKAAHPKSEFMASVNQLIPQVEKELSPKAH